MSPDDVGLNSARLLAGFAGGVVHAINFRQGSAVGQLVSVVTGTLTANWLSPAAAHYIGGWFGDGGSAFIVGFCAMVIVQGIDAAARSRIAKIQGDGLHDESK